jgi:hypothetical protein
MLFRSISSSKSAVIFSTLLLFQTLASSSEAADLCQRVLGEWTWFIGGKVTFSPHAQARWTPSVASIPPASGTWSCDPRSGTYTVTWQNGFVDTLNLSDDGTQLSGTSSTGAAVSGRRATSTARTEPEVRAKGVPEQGTGGWIPGGNRPPQKGPKPFKGW